jgi:hypothetical protein
MADREFTLNVKLTAQNDTDRAFAEASTNIEAYNRLIEEQAAKSDVVVKANRKLAQSHEDLASTQDSVIQRYPKVLAAQAEYGKALEAQARAESNYRKGDIQSQAARAKAIQDSIDAQKRLQKAIDDTGNASVQRSSRTIAASQRETAVRREQEKVLDRLTQKTTELGAATDSRKIADLKRSIDDLAISAKNLGIQQESIARTSEAAFDIGRQKQFEAAQSRVNATMREYQKLVDSVAKAEKARDERIALARARTPSGSSNPKLDAAISDARQRVVDANADLKRFTESRRASGVVPTNFRRDVEQRRMALEGGDILNRRGGATGASRPKIGPGTNDPYGLAPLSKAAQGVQKNAAGVGKSFSGMLSAFSPALIQPIILLMTGMAAGMASIGSAALSAGTAMSSVFLVSMAQAVPVMGLFGAAMQRLQGVMGLVSGELALQQQRFIAQYQAAYQNSLGINQIVLAQHQYSDALYAQNQALYQVRVAELGLLSARQQATRQLEQLIFQEENAKLAAESSALAVSDAQKAVQQAVRTGGDVNQAMLQLQQAQVSHHQSVFAARNAITDASRGSIARQQITQQVVQAQRAVVQARRAVVDANFAAVQARAAVIQAEQAQRGFNIATAAQLAYLRSQMTQTELSLSRNILKIFELFRGAHGILTPMTNAILAPFIGITARIYALLHDPRILRSLQDLANGIGTVITRVSHVFLGNQGIKTFITIIEAAARNMAPLGTIISGIFRAMGSIITTAIPYVHQFAGFIAGLIRQFAGWANKNSGKKSWLANWFDEAFKSLEAFIRLGVALGKLIAAIVGVGGGAKSGINTLGELTKTINKATDSINKHGKAWHDLQRIWASVGPVMHVIGQILGALGAAFLKLTGTRQGQEALKGIGDIISKILIPAFANFAGEMGKVMAWIGRFLDQNPKVAGELKNFLTVALIAGGAMKIFGALFSPLFKLIGLMASLAKFAKAFSTSMGLVSGEGFAEALGAIAGPAAIIAAVVGSIILLAKWTGTLKQLWQAIEAPFIAIWNAIKAPVQNLIKQFELLIGKGTAFKNFVREDLSGVFTVMKTILGGIGKIIGDVLGHAITEWADFFKAIHDLTQGHIGAFAKDFLKMGEAMVSGLWDGLKDLISTIAKVFVDLFNWVLHFFGISSPSRKFRSIGKSIVDGLMSALLGLPNMFLHLAERVVEFFIKGISKLPSAAGKLISGIIPGPIKSLVGGAAHVGGQILGTSGHGGILHGFGLWNQGGAVPGFGGGDTVSAKLEPGEHVLTKNEVMAAGGHGAIFALRRALGGGTQGGGGRYAAGGMVGTITTSIPTINPDRAASYSQYYTQILMLLNDFINAYTSNTKTLWQTVLTDSNQSLQKLIVETNQALEKLLTNFRQTYNQISQDTHKAFDYITKAANSDLRAFGAKPARVSVEAPPHFAGGGYVGQKGERGDDVVHAMLGRGEAVLNYAHQRVVEPAMRAFYGWGLGDMFGKVRASHGQGRGYSTGGYVYPFPAGAQIGRTDQGVDVDLAVGAPIGPMGRARVMGHLANWYQGQPLIWWQLLDGIRQGAYAYVAEQITNLAPVGAILNANDAVARYAASGTGIEYGWATANGSTLARVQDGVGGGAATSAGANMRAFISGLSRGKLTSTLMGSMASAASAALGLPQITDLTVRGSGALHDLLRHVVHRVTGAANKFLGATGGGGGGPRGNITGAGIAPGSWMRVASQIARRMGWGPAELAAWQGVEHIEDSSYSLTAKNPHSRAYGLAQGITGPNWYYGYGGNPNTLVGQLVAMGNYIKGRYGTPMGALAHEHSAGWYNQGGFVGKAMPIIAHAGEWVVNKAQQHGLARRLGTTVGGLKNSMGFTGGPDSFAGGGEVGGASNLGNYSPTYAPSRYGNMQTGTYSSTTGAYATSLITGLSDYTASFDIAALQTYQQAQRTVEIVRETGKKFAGGLNQFLKNWDQVGGSNGLFAAAAQAVSNFANQQASAVQLASVGFRTSATGLLTRMRTGPQTVLEAARTTTNSLSRVIGQTNDLLHSYTASLSSVNNQIAQGRRRVRNFDSTKAYVRLEAARNQLIDGIQAQDQNLAQDYTTQIQNRQAEFQAQYTQRLRGTGTLTGSQAANALRRGVVNIRNIGPQIASGIISTAQSVAQTFGRYGALTRAGGVDDQAISVAKAQRDALQTAYSQAAARARKDPRWQAVADDLLTQVESATQAVAQAQAQALTDAITRVQNSQTLQQAAFQMGTTINQAIAATSSAFGAQNQYSAAASNISLNAANTTALYSQRDQYQGLLNTAQAQGNQAAVLQLTQAIDDLNGQIAQSIVATQQAVTAYQQLSVNILSSTSSSSSSFIQSATGIITTLGNITGSLNLPQQIQTLQEYGSGLAQQAQSAVSSIQSAIAGTNGQSAFGAAAGTANTYLAQAVNAFNQGPQAYASWLAANSQGLASFQAGLPQDQQALFNGLIQALTDNTTATVQNNLQLQNLNATSNQQQFSSAAWQQFRTAIFNGIGGLLPQYAMQVPSLDVGGTLTSHGLIYAHKGETVTPATVTRGAPPSAPTHQEIHNHFTEPMEVADPVHISNRIAWAINHSPNSR